MQKHHEQNSWLVGDEMRKQVTLAFLLALFTGMASAQSTTTGTVVCQSGTQQTVCLGNSTTTDANTNNTNTAEQQREAYETGQALGRGIASMRATAGFINRFGLKAGTYAAEGHSA